jgi:hypothetical protein
MDLQYKSFSLGLIILLLLNSGFLLLCYYFIALCCFEEDEDSEEEQIRSGEIDREQEFIDPIFTNPSEEATFLARYKNDIFSKGERTEVYMDNYENYMQFEDNTIEPFKFYFRRYTPNRGYISEIP